MYLISPNDYLQHAGVSAQTKEVGEILFHIHKISINITLKNLEDIQFFFFNNETHCQSGTQINDLLS